MNELIVSAENQDLWNPNWPVMGYGRVSIGHGKSPDGVPCLLYMDLGEARPIDADTTDVFPVGSIASKDKTLACIYFKDSAAMQQTIDVIREMQQALDRPFPEQVQIEEKAIPGIDQERKIAEREYTASCFDYESSPVGSRDWVLYWAGWLARSVAVIAGKSD